MSSNHGLRFNYAHESRDRPLEPEYTRQFGDPVPPITAYGNIQYLDFIEMVKQSWNDANPEIHFRPFADNNVYDPERGYVIYSVVQKVPKDGNLKPKAQHNWKDEATGKYYSVFRQSFIHTVRFHAVHTDAEVADEIIENFEDFMMEMTPVLKLNGLEDIFYFQRIADTNQSRFGNDVAVRSVDYRLITQKLLIVENATLNEFFVRVTTVMGGDSTPSTIEVPYPE